jgi:hypothetical protein
MCGSDPLNGLRGLVKDAAEARPRRLVKAPTIEAVLMLLVEDGDQWEQ